MVVDADDEEGEEDRDGSEEYRDDIEEDEEEKGGEEEVEVEVEDVLFTPILSIISPGILLILFKPIFFEILFLSITVIFFIFFENFETFSISVKKSSSACFLSTENDGFETVFVVIGKSVLLFISIFSNSANSAWIRL